MDQYPEPSEWGDRGVCVGYDGRYNSRRFAELTAIVFLNCNFRVFLYNRTVATPIIPYTVLRLKCLAGVMITASHNPKQDNGYKASILLCLGLVVMEFRIVPVLQVYWSNGAQVIAPHDDAIEDAIVNNLKPIEGAWDDTILCANEWLTDPYEIVVPAYFDALKRQMTCATMEANGKCPVRFTYTAMHGVGYPYVRMGFAKIGLKRVLPVCEQVEPDPEFPTTPIPNPEEGKSALQLAIKKATENKSEIILANDPDADRLAVAEVDEKNDYKIFTGNELGALLGWWALETYKLNEAEPDLSKVVMISSSVSSKILKSMAEQEGFIHHETPIGFKYIGNKAIEEANAGKKVLFGFEESIGFMVSTTVFDKDGISAAAQLATMACYLRCKKCMTLDEKLRDIYENYGYHKSFTTYLTSSNPIVTECIFDKLRHFDDGDINSYPMNVLDGEYEVESVSDLTIGYDSATPDKKTVFPATPDTQSITWTFKNGATVTLRASGTEPKIKVYTSMNGKPENKRWDKIDETVDILTNAVINEFLEPEENLLQRKPEEPPAKKC